MLSLVALLLAAPASAAPFTPNRDELSIELLSQFCAAGDGAPPVQGLLRAAEASPPPPVPPPPPPALE